MSTNTIAVLGYGNVGGTLARAFLAAGQRVTLASFADRPDAAQAAKDADPRLAGATVAPVAQAIVDAELVVLTLPFGALSTVLAPLAEALTGKTVIDATNPVGPGLTHALGSSSGAAHVADLLPGAHVVKAFNVYGAENLGGVPAHGDARPMMPFAGDDDAAKQQVNELLSTLGWDGMDAGPLIAALDLEHLALFWIRMVRMGGQDPHLVWSALRWTP